MVLFGCAGHAASSCQEGEISYYATRFEGQRTASGEIFHHSALTAAHRSIAFGTELEVVVGARSVRVRVNDRGPFARNRILDISGKAAELLGIRSLGHASARICIAGSFQSLPNPALAR